MPTLLKLTYSMDHVEHVTCLFACDSLGQEGDEKRADHFIAKYLNGGVDEFADAMNVDSLDLEVIPVRDQDSGLIEQLVGVDLYFPDFPFEEYLQFIAETEDEDEVEEGHYYDGDSDGLSDEEY